MSAISRLTLPPTTPKAAEKPALVNPADFAERGPEETAPLYFWVDAKDKYAEKEPEPEPEPAEVIPALGVAAEKLVTGAWSNEMPVFTLSGIPEGMAWSYAAIIYDERIIPMSGNTYTPDAEGQYHAALCHAGRHRRHRQRLRDLSRSGWTPRSRRP